MQFIASKTTATTMTLKLCLVVNLQPSDARLGGNYSKIKHAGIRQAKDPGERERLGQVDVAVFDRTANFLFFGRYLCN